MRLIFLSILFTVCNGAPFFNYDADNEDRMPHHLFVGRCGPDDKLLHQENVVLKNDGKSQTNALIKVIVEGDVRITCVKITDEIGNGEGGYPNFVAFERNFVEFTVEQDYGKGFHFFIEIYGLDDR